MVNLFDLLKREFGFTKGALLTRHRESAYFLPLAQTGLDVTSRNRLRFPVDGIEEEARKKGEWLSPESFDHLRPYLSSREFELIEEVLILPIPSSDGIAAILLILGEDPEELEPLRRMDQEQLADFQEELGRFFASIKMFSLASPQRELNEDEGLRSFIRRALTEKQVLSVLHFDLSPLLERLMTISDDVDIFRARKDTLRIIETLFESNARLRPLKDDHFLLLLGSKHKQTPKLLQHQVGLALKNFFSSDISGIEFEPLEFSNAAQSAEDLIQELERLDVARL